ncbi:MAG: hypothetical protein Q4B25_11350, partial [Pseudomonadota bacterium]|nr:hypothetical protein [Pseudomonadota bacterium]
KGFLEDNTIICLFWRKRIHNTPDSMFSGLFPLLSGLPSSSVSRRMGPRQTARFHGFRGGVHRSKGMHSWPRRQQGKTFNINNSDSQELSCKKIREQAGSVPFGTERGERQLLFL